MLASPNPHPIELISTVCAICKTADNSVEVFPANFSVSDFSVETFSARRMPDRIHYRLVRCKVCGLVRSDPVVDAQTLASLYSQSKQTYNGEIGHLMDSYGRYLERVGRYHLEKDSLLEIGCGSGFFLEKAWQLGYQNVLGIEPSRDAVTKAKPNIRPHIRCEMMRSGLLPPEQFDVVCLFQVFDHLSEPANALAEIRAALKPGGCVLCLNHDVQALSARLLGESSPIIDIEHTYLYDKNTIRKIFTQAGFEVKEVGSASNRYSLAYLAQLFPFPKSIKNNVIGMMSNHAVGRIPLTVRLGNLYLIAQKPAE